MESGTPGHRDSQIVVVDLGEPQSQEQVRRLSKGKGKLYKQVERVVDDLIEAGTVKSNAQTVVIVVREFPFPFPSFSRFWQDDDKDKDD